ncbi:MAG: MBL fold metallo-hydrolase [Nitrospinales bacterium]
MDTELEDELGDVVQKARAGRSWSQQDLARACGVAVADIDRIENCDLIPDNARITRIADALNLHGPALIEVARKTYMPAPPEPDPDFDLVCLRVFMGMYPVKCYLLICKQTREAAAIDTGGNPEAVIRKAGELGVTPRKILLTHTHADHAGGLHRLDAEFNCPTWVDRAEPWPPGSRDLRLVKDGDCIPLGRLRIRVIATPGHTAGGVCYRINNSVVSGDAIFAGSMGRANVSFPALFNAVVDKLLTLPDATALYPAHGPATTVGQEKRHNPFFSSLKQPV